MQMITVLVNGSEASRADILVRDHHNGTQILQHISTLSSSPASPDSQPGQRSRGLAKEAGNNPQGTLHGGNGSRGDVRGVDSCKLATHEITRTSAELIIAVGVDLDQGLDGDEGKYRLKIQQSEGGCFVSALVCSSPDMGEGSTLDVGGADQVRYHPSGPSRRRPQYVPLFVRSYFSSLMTS